MLVISLKPGEEIRLGEEITVRVLGANASRVRLGVEAPSQVRVLREESCAGGPAKDAKKS